jgi:hypothetical protein
MKFQVRIADRLFFSDEEMEKSKKIVETLKEMERELPQIEKGEEVARERYWEASEALRKGNTLSLNTGEMQKLQTALFSAQGELRGPRQDLSRRWQEKCGEYDFLTLPFQNEIVELIEKSLKEVQLAKTARQLSSEKKWVDDRNWGHDRKFHTIEQNFENVEKIIDLLVKFRLEVRTGMKYFSHKQIMDRIREFEDKVNNIDITKFEKQEITRTQWEELREAKLL